MAPQEKELAYDYKIELEAFGQRVKARREAERYAPWHPRSVITHPRRTWRLAFGGGIVSDGEWEGVMAHMDDKGTGNGSKKGK